MLTLDKFLAKENVENTSLNASSRRQSRPAKQLTATGPAETRVNRRGRSLTVKRKRCPRCGSYNIRPKGYIYRRSTDEDVRILKCKDCGLRFRENTLRKWRRETLPDDIIIKYLEGFENLKSLKDIMSLPQSISTIHRYIIESAPTYPSWRELLMREDVRKAWGHVMGLDTTEIKIKGSRYIFLFVVDIPSKLPLAYQILTSKEAKLIANVLRKIKASGYKPKLIVTDLAEELLKAVSEVFPGVPVQRCLFHLKYWLNKELPTRVRSKHMGKTRREKIRRWKEVKKRIINIALAANKAERQKQINELLKMNLDNKARDVMRRFIEKLHYCHTLDQVEKLGCELKDLYNNVCENAMKEVKHLQRRMRGFKNVKNAAAYIKVLWYIRTKKILENKPVNKAEHITSYNVPLILFEGEDIINLRELSETSGISIENLTSEAERLRMTVIGEYALTRRCINKISTTIHREKPKTIEEASKRLNLDVNLLTRLLPKIQTKILFHQIDPKHAEIKYLPNLDPYTVTNETVKNPQQLKEKTVTNETG